MIGCSRASLRTCQILFWIVHCSKSSRIKRVCDNMATRSYKPDLKSMLVLQRVQKLASCSGDQGR